MGGPAQDPKLQQVLELTTISLTDHERIVFNAAADRKGLGRNAARNAFRHIDLAYKLETLDPAMAAFRAITAEEEAATAILWAVAKQGYKLSKHLDYRQHFGKGAVINFIKLVENHFARGQLFDGFPPQVNFYPQEPYISLRIPVPGIQLFAEILPPLNFSMKAESGPVHFEDEFDLLCRDNNLAAVSQFIKARIKERNSLLYAADDGIAFVEFGNGYLPKKRRSVFAMLCLYLMIDCNPEPQLFVLQSIEALEKMVNYALKDAMS